MRILKAVAAGLVAAILLFLPVAAQPDPEAQLVSDIKVEGGSDPRYLTAAGGLVFFSATDRTHGKELWVTDGTAAGTRLVRDINTGRAGSSPRHLTKVGSRIFFSAVDKGHGRELWASDGTRAGTRLVKDLTKGSKGSAITGIADGAGTAWVVRSARDLWRSYGTGAGTRFVRTFGGVSVAESVVVGKELYFSADGLWRTTGAGVTRLTPAGDSVDQLVRFKGKVYFRRVASSGPPGAEPSPELWRSDGTATGTRRFGQVHDPASPVVLGDRLYLNGRRPAGADRLFGSDGTAARTAPLQPRVGPLWGLIGAAGHLWSAMETSGWGEPDSLWVSDGTSAGTQRVFGGDGDWFVTDWRGLDGVGFEGELWFAAGPGELVAPDDWQLTDQELWASDGTPAGTREAADLNPAGSSFPRGFTRLGPAILFSADDGEHGRELWSLRVP